MASQTLERPMATAGETGWATTMARRAAAAGESLAASTRGLTKRYGDATVVDDMDLEVPEGAVYGFLGPNGAGKSTTMKMLLGLVHPTGGRAIVLGREMTPANRLEVLRQVGSLIEAPSCYPHLTARENLEIVRRLRGLPESCIDEALSVVRLDDAKTQGKLVGHFSLGMKQRLGIAVALMGRPRLLLLDEPTNGLDPSGIHEIRQLIREMPGRFGCTVIVSSHLLSEIDQMADHVGIINRGRMVWQGSMADLHARARRWLALRTTDNAAAAGVLPGTVADGEWLRIKAVDDATAGQVTLGLARRGIGVVRLEERSESLEDIFLKLTGMEATPLRLPLVPHLAHQTVARVPKYASLLFRGNLRHQENPSHGTSQFTFFDWRKTYAISSCCIGHRPAWPRPIRRARVCQGAPQAPVAGEPGSARVPVRLARRGRLQHRAPQP